MEKSQSGTKEVLRLKEVHCGCAINYCWMRILQHSVCEHFVEDINTLKSGLSAYRYHAAVTICVDTKETLA